MMAENPWERLPSLKAVADELATILKSPAVKVASKEQPASSPGLLPAGDRTRSDGGASQVLKSLNSEDGDWRATGVAGSNWPANDDSCRDSSR